MLTTKESAASKLETAESPFKKALICTFSAFSFLWILQLKKPKNL